MRLGVGGGVARVGEAAIFLLGVWLPVCRHLFTKGRAFTTKLVALLIGRFLLLLARKFRAEHQVVEDLLLLLGAVAGVLTVLVKVEFDERGRGRVQRFVRCLGVQVFVLDARALPRGRDGFVESRFLFEAVLFPLRLLLMRLFFEWALDQF